MAELVAILDHREQNAIYDRRTERAKQRSDETDAPPSLSPQILSNMFLICSKHFGETSPRAAINPPVTINPANNAYE